MNHLGVLRTKIFGAWSTIGGIPIFISRVTSAIVVGDSLDGTWRDHPRPGVDARLSVIWNTERSEFYLTQILLPDEAARNQVENSFSV